MLTTTPTVASPEVYRLHSSSYILTLLFTLSTPGVILLWHVCKSIKSSDLYPPSAVIKSSTCFRPSISFGFFSLQQLGGTLKFVYNGYNYDVDLLSKSRGVIYVTLLSKPLSCKIDVYHNKQFYITMSTPLRCCFNITFLQRLYTTFISGKTIWEPKGDVVYVLGWHGYL